MNRRIYSKKNPALLICILLLLILTGCGPSEEKILKAQETYTQLTDIHNQVVEAHKSISDSSLDEKLVALADQAVLIEDYNLKELKDEDIDLLIENMNSIIISYQEYLNEINTIKEKEDAAVLTALPVTLLNETQLTFTVLKLYSENDTDQSFDVLENTSGFSPKQTLTGLIIYRDVSSTPWILKLADTAGTSYEIELPVDEYDETGTELMITFDSELKVTKCS